MKTARIICLILVVLCFKSAEFAEVDGKPVVLVSAVLAPPKDQDHGVDRSKDFPLLMLFTTDRKTAYQERVKKAKSEPRPVYVKKLEDQVDVPRVPDRKRKPSTKKMDQNRH